MLSNVHESLRTLNVAVALLVLNTFWVDAFESTQSSTKYVYV